MTQASKTPKASTKAPATKPASSTPTKPKRQMSESHKASLAEGREQSRIVGTYLEALGKSKKKRGRQVTVETLRTRLEKAQGAFDGASAIERLKLTQQVRDLKAQIATMEASPTVDLPALEADFVRVAKPYSESQGITRAAFIENGVPKSVLVAAGI